MGMSSGGSGGAAGGVNATINVTPLADVMLVLLIIFMITLPLIQEGVYVNKASARNALEAPAADDENATIVTVTRNQDIYIGQDRVPEGDVIPRLVERVALAPELPLFVKADVAVAYGTIVELVNRARDAGVEQIGLLVDRQEGQ
jgi:biopolymer transport protein TolR